MLERQHTLRSEFLGHDSLGHAQFATTRSELGELVFRLKNRNDRTALPDIAATAADFVRKRGLQLDAIVPVPPSRRRQFQPVAEVAKALGERLSVPVVKGAVTKAKETPQLDAGASAVCFLAITKTSNEVMTKVFIAGSRQISRLPAEVKNRVDTMLDKGFQILVGDANGADQAVQSYLAEKAYANVLVHCMKGHCRNNIGHWPTHEVPPPKGARGFDFYSAKDRVMADAAEYGLMLWDGKSKGTINNLVNLCREGKPVVVYHRSL